MLKRGVIFAILLVMLTAFSAYFADAYCYTSCIGREDIDIISRYYGGNNPDADVNGDGTVSILDIAAIGSLNGVCEGASNYNLKYDLSKKLSCIGSEDTAIWNTVQDDLNGDGQKSVQDIAVISANYGTCNTNDDNSIDLSQKYGAAKIGMSLYKDIDIDGYGSNKPGDAIKLCYQPNQYQTNNWDCNDNDANIRPGAEELCNNIDDNCNGNVDEDLIRSCGVTGGACKLGTRACNNGNWGACFGNVDPRPENFQQGNCNDQSDNDCDGFPDYQDNTDDLHCQEMPGNLDGSSGEICNNGFDDDNDGMADIDDPGCTSINNQFFLPVNLFEDKTPFIRQETGLVNQFAQYCGDDGNEFYRICSVGKDVVCSGTNFACCDWNTDAVYEGKCYGSYSDKVFKTIQKDVFKVNDIFVLEDEGLWYDCDGNKNDCSACDDGSGAWKNKVGFGPGGESTTFNNFPTCQGEDCWVRAGQAGVGEYKNFGETGTQSCCGDDSGERFVYTEINGGPQNIRKEYFACCSGGPFTCVDSNGMCQSGIESGSACTDGIDNNCNGLIDCEDPNCGSGTLDFSCSNEPFCNSRFVSGDLVDRTDLAGHAKDDKQWIASPKAEGEPCSVGNLNGEFTCSSGQGAGHYNKPGDFVCQGVCNKVGQCVATNCYDCNLLGGGTGDEFDTSTPSYCGTFEGKQAVFGKGIDYTCSNAGPAATNPESLCGSSNVDQALDVCDTPFEVCRTAEGQGALCQPVVLDLFRSVFKIWVT